MIMNQRKVTSYNDFVKSLKCSKGSTIASTTTVTPKLTRDAKQNKSMNEQLKPKHLRYHDQQKQILTSRPKSFDKESRRGIHSNNGNQHSITTRFNTDSDLMATQRGSCEKSKSKSKSKGHFDSQSTANRQSATKRMSDPNMIVYYTNEILMVLEEMPRVNPIKIAYLDYLELLRLLNMIQNHYQPSKSDHVHRFWSIIATKDSTINIINFTVMFLASMNVQSSSKSIIQIFEASWNQQIPLQTFKKSKSNLIRVDKLGYLSLNKDQVKEVYTEFKQFRTTRMFLGKIQKKATLIEQKLQQYSFHKFHPTISNKSVQLAKIKKERQNHKVSMSEQMFEEEKIIRYEIENKKDIVSPREKSNLGLKRTQMLYNLCKSKSKEKRDRSQDEIEFERNSKLYTFKPQIHYKSNKNMAVEKKQNSISGETKILQRFLKGRIQKQVKKKNMELGNTNNSKSTQKLRKRIAEQFSEKNLMRHSSPVHITPPNKQTQKQHSQHLEHIPEFHSIPKPSPQKEQTLDHTKKEIFNFEVYLEGGIFVDVIRVYEGDCVEAIASQFIIKHKLKPEMQAKLIYSIKSNLESVHEQSEGLEQIEEERESVECSFDLGR